MKVIAQEDERIESGATEGARRAGGVGPDSAADGVGPNPEVADKATRRRFSAEYKRRIVRAADRCRKPGELGSLLRREGVYSSSLSKWRRQLDSGELAGVGTVKRGPKAKPTDPRDKRIAELERETRRLEARLEKAETIIAIQKKLRPCWGFPSIAPTTPRTADGSPPNPLF